jgi:hypothetical protein
MLPDKVKNKLKTATSKHLRRSKRIQFLKFGAKIRVGKLKRNWKWEIDENPGGFGGQLLSERKILPDLSQIN